MTEKKQFIDLTEAEKISFCKIFAKAQKLQKKIDKHEEVFGSLKYFDSFTDWNYKCATLITLERGFLIKQSPQTENK